MASVGSHIIAGPGMPDWVSLNKEVHSPTDRKVCKDHTKSTLWSPQFSSDVDPGIYADSKYLLPPLGEKDPSFFSCTSFPVIEKTTTTQDLCLLLSLCQSCDSDDTALSGCILNKTVCQWEGAIWNNMKRKHASGFYHLWAVCPWASFLKPLSLGFLIWKNKNNIQFTGCFWRLEWVVSVKLLIL